MRAFFIARTRLEALGGLLVHRETQYTSRESKSLVGQMRAFDSFDRLSKVIIPRNYF